MCLDAFAAGEDVECLSEVNAEREAAGLTNFTTASDGTKLTAPDASELQDNSEWKKVCTHLIPVGGTEKYQCRGYKGNPVV